MTKKLLLSLASTLAASALVGSLANAGDVDFVLHGTACHTNGTVRYSQWGADNLTTSIQTVICPIQGRFDNRDGLAWTTIERLQVWVYNRNPDQAFSCTLRSHNNDGDINTSVTRAIKASESAVQLLDFWPNLGLHLDASLTLECRIPAQHADGISHLTSIKVIPR